MKTILFAIICSTVVAACQQGAQTIQSPDVPASAPDASPQGMGGGGR